MKSQNHPQEKYDKRVRAAEREDRHVLDSHLITQAMCTKKLFIKTVTCPDHESLWQIDRGQAGWQAAGRSRHTAGTKCAAIHARVGIRSISANMKNWPNVVLMLGQRRRRWTNIKTTLGYFLMLGSNSPQVFTDKYIASKSTVCDVFFSYITCILLRVKSWDRYGRRTL